MMCRLSCKLSVQVHIMKIPAVIGTYIVYEIVHHPFHKGFIGGMASKQNYTNYFNQVMYL